MAQGGLLRVSTREPTFRGLLVTEDKRRHSVMTPDTVVFRKKKPALLRMRKHLSEINPTFVKDNEPLTTTKVKLFNFHYFYPICFAFWE